MHEAENSQQLLPRQQSFLFPYLLQLEKALSIKYSPLFLERPQQYFQVFFHSLHAKTDQFDLSQQFLSPNTRHRTNALFFLPYLKQVWEKMRPLDFLLLQAYQLRRPLDSQSYKTLQPYQKPLPQHHRLSFLEPRLYQNPRPCK